MNKETALKIMSCLREGLDPRTGAEIPNDSVFQMSIVTRAIYTACDALKSQIKADARRLKRNEEKRINMPKMQGQRWLPEEDEVLREEIEKGMSVYEIAVAHQRSLLSIQKRIEKLNS